MKNSLRLIHITALTAFLFAIPSLAHAQGTASSKQQVISANPFGILLGIFNAEYERIVSQSSTLGIGGSIVENDEDDDDEDYVNADAFFRYYPGGEPLRGWAFGIKAGVTKVTNHGSYFGIGFDLNHSWLLGRTDNFYVGLGFGLKRLYGTPDDDDDLFDEVPTVIPTFRIVNVGFRF